MIWVFLTLLVTVALESVLIAFSWPQILEIIKAKRVGYLGIRLRNDGKIDFIAPAKVDTKKKVIVLKKGNPKKGIEDVRILPEIEDVKEMNKFFIPYFKDKIAVFFIDENNLSLVDPYEKAAAKPDALAIDHMMVLNKVELMAEGELMRKSAEKKKFEFNWTTMLIGLIVILAIIMLGGKFLGGLFG